MELRPIDGRRLVLDKDDSTAFARVCAILDTMARSMNDTDYGVLVDHMASTDYFSSLCADEGNELVDEFIRQDSDCQKILTTLSEFLYLLYEAAATPTV